MKPRRSKPAWRSLKRTLALGGLLGLPLLGLPLPGLRSAARSGETQNENRPEDRQEQGAALAAELLAVESHAVYLALDPRGGHLDLKVDGLKLRRFRIERGLFGRPRLSGGGGGLSAAHFRLVTELPEPDRPLIPIRSPKEGAGAGSSSLAVSEARTEAVAQMPSHYRLRFEPPLEISIRGESGAADREAGMLSSFWRLRFRLYEGWQAIGHRLRGQPVPPRIVLFLPPDEARRLFMTLDPAMQLVIAARASSDRSGSPGAPAAAPGR